MLVESQEVDHAVIIGWSPDQRAVRESPLAHSITEMYALVAALERLVTGVGQGLVVTDWSQFGSRTCRHQSAAR